MDSVCQVACLSYVSPAMYSDGQCLSGCLSKLCESSNAVMDSVCQVACLSYVSPAMYSDGQYLSGCLSKLCESSNVQ